MHAQRVDSKRILISADHVGVDNNGCPTSCMRTYGYDDGNWFFVGGGSIHYNISEIRMRKHFMVDDNYAIERIFENQTPIGRWYSVLADDIVIQLNSEIRDFKIQNILND